MERDLFSNAEKELRQKLGALVEVLSALSTVSVLDADIRDEQGLMRKALRLLLESREIQQASIYLIEDDHLVRLASLDHRELHIADDQLPVLPLAHRFRVGEGVMGIACASGRLQHCRNCAVDPRYQVVDGGGRRSGSLIAAPITLRSGVLGVLNVVHPEAGHFSLWHERLLMVYSNIIAQMIHNSRLLRRTEEQVQRRTGQLREALAQAELLRQRYEELSFVDDLTGLHNRRFFFAEAHTALERILRYGGDFSIVAIDIDHFKGVNDTYGHAVGDTVLATVARLLAGHTRGGDILARLGGEEFALALPHTHLTGARTLTERIRAALAAARIDSGDGDITVTLSAGISSARAPLAADADRQPGQVPGQVLDRLINEADAALYRAKEMGRNRVCQHPLLQAVVESPERKLSA